MLLDIKPHPFIAQAILFTFQNNEGMQVVFCNVGASIRSIALHHLEQSFSITPDVDDETFFSSEYLWGKTLGRVSGLICHSLIHIGNESFALEPNQGVHTLHSGRHNVALKAFDYRLQYEVDGCSLIFTYQSPFGEGGFPGQLTLQVSYRVFDHISRIEVSYEATSNYPTVVNPSMLLPLNLSTGFSSFKQPTFTFSCDAIMQENSEQCAIGWSPIPIDMQARMNAQTLHPLFLNQTFHVTSPIVSFASSSWQVKSESTYEDLRLIHDSKTDVVGWLWHRSPLFTDAMLLKPTQTFFQRITYEFTSVKSPSNVIK